MREETETGAYHVALQTPFPCPAPAPQGPTALPQDSAWALTSPLSLDEQGMSYGQEQITRNFKKTL